jgi:type I restriction-modification system DNA methylase subunit
MSEELIQRNLYANPEKMGAWSYYNIGATTLKALKAAKIIPNHDYAEYESKKPDALVVKKPQVIVAIEYKQPKELRTKRQIEAAISQEIGTANALGAKIYIVTDGQKTFWINPLTGNEIKSETGGRISLNFDKNDVECVKLIGKAIASLSTTNDVLFQFAVVDPLPLAQKVWQDLWSVSGATPENCLYTFVEVFIFKYLSDLGVLTGLHSFSHLIAQYSSNTENEVIEYYASTVRVKIKELFPWNPKDKTTIINGTIFVSKDDKAVSGYATVFKKILERFRDFGTLENIDYDFKSKLFETFLKESISKKNWGQFFTPLKVVRAIVSMSDINQGMKICDPACGVGKFLLEPILHDINHYFKVENGNLIPQITLSGFDKGFDKDEQKTIILAKANMLIYLSTMIREHTDITKQFAQLFNDTFLLQTNSILGTLAKATVDEYDLILTNPPYVMSGSSNLKDEISKRTPEETANKQKSSLEQHYAISAMGVEGLFMEWIIRALIPGGKAFVVVPDGIMNRSNDKRLRDFILDECNIDAVISLPINTFFTTNKKTYIMAITKKIPAVTNGISEKAHQTTPVFTYLCSEIGETRDVYRFDMEQNDLDNAAQLFNVFKGIKNNPAIVQKHCEPDKRCKVVSIDEFYNGSHWSVERWWTREEKIALGIGEELSEMDISNYALLIRDTAASLLDISSELEELQKSSLESDKKKLKIQKVKVTDVFTIERGKGLYTLKYVQQHRGEFPLFSGNTTRCFASIDSYDYDKPCLSWAIDGLAGYMMKHEIPFSATNHRGVLVPKSENIDLGYVMMVLEPLFRALKKGRVGDVGENEYTSLPPFMIKQLEFDVPVQDNGDFDILAQRELSEQSERIVELKGDLSNWREQVTSASVTVDISGYSMVVKPLFEILAPTKGKSKYTRKYGEVNKGEYPVYSASSSTPLTHISSFDYDGEYLSWATNGFAGKITVLSGRFSINGDRGLLLPKVSNLNIHYLKYILEPIFRQLAKGRKGDHGEDEFTKLYPSMLAEIDVPIPVDENAEISLLAQQEIAKSYTTIETYRREVLGKIDSLIAQRISY